MVENEHGELRYATFDRADDLAQLVDAPAGAIVAFEPRAMAVSPADEAVARVAARTGGLYSAGHHASVEPHVSDGLIASNIRRLEAMRRARLVVRSADGAFEISGDHLSRAMTFEQKLAKRSPLSAAIRSYWTLSEQIDATGPTHLDRVLAGMERAPEGQGGVVRRHATALQQRRQFLIAQGLMRGDDRLLPRSAIDTMAVKEMRQAAGRLSRELGRPVLRHVTGEVRGVYAQRVDLAQGRVALILQDTQGFLVPWRPALERFAGRDVTGVTRGRTISWSLNRARGPDLPPM